MQVKVQGWIKQNLETEQKNFGRYFEGNRKVKEKEPIIIGTTPPDYTSKFIMPTLEDEFFKKYATVKDNIALVTTGTYTDEEQLRKSMFPW